jgi:hypothetical protein
VIPQNDLEALTIAKMLRRAKEHTIQIRVPWGARWKALPEDVAARIRDFRQQHPEALIYGVELAGPNSFNAVNIDHHRYADNDDRSSPESSLEQVASILGTLLTPHQRLVAINDRAGIRGLTEAHATLKKIRRIRAADRKAQHVGPAEMKQAKQDLASARRVGDTWIVTCQDRPTSAHTDQLWEREQRVEPVLLQSPEQWFYSGPEADRLSGLTFTEPHWSGGSPQWGYFGIEKPGDDARAALLRELGIEPGPRT